MCLEVDQSIPKNAGFTIYAFGYVFGNEIYPVQGSFQFDGLQVCGTVWNFPDIVFIPILAPTSNIHLINKVVY